MQTPPDTISALERWLQASPQTSPIDEIETLRGHLLALGELRAPASAQYRLVEGLHVRAQAAIEALIPRLYGVKLPISHKTRQIVKWMQDALDALVRMGLDLVEAPDSQLVRGLGTPPDVALWRIMHAIGRHIALSDLTATPYPAGAWQALHRAYLAARRHRVEQRTPTGAQYSLQSLYARTLLLGTLPVSALSALEWGYLHQVAARMPFAVRILDSEPEDGGITFWVAPELDMPPVHFERKAPADGTLAIYVQLPDFLDEVGRQIDALEAGLRPLDLPDDISPRAARIALDRVRDYLGSPKKRRFPRRRQGYRATLCFGLPDIVTILRTGSDVGIDLSEWMIVNESPGGYAAMHVAGRPHKVQVGDLIALLREGESNWSVCVVRWALSENPEHLELGLREISPRVVVGHMASPGMPTTDEHPALLLPAVPPLRTSDAIAFSPNERPAEQRKHLLVLDGDGARVREFRLGPTIEQSAEIEVALIAPENQV